MKINLSEIKNLEITIQAKGIFILTFICSTVLFIMMTVTVHSSFGYTIFYFGSLYVFLFGSLNIIIAIYELYEAVTNKNHFKIHINSSLLILSNILIGTIYILLIIFIESEF